MLASRLHEHIMKNATASDEEQEDNGTIVYSEREQLLLNYLDTHGGITLEGYMKLAHISEETAMQTVVTLHGMGLLTVQYHDGQCLIVAI